MKEENVRLRYVRIKKLSLIHSSYFGICAPVAEQILEAVPDIEAGAIVAYDGPKKMVVTNEKGDRQTFEEDYCIVSPDFFEVFSPRIKAGDPVSYTHLVKVSEKNCSAAIAKMMALWKEIAPDEQPFEWETLADACRNLHRDQQKMFRLVLVFSWISLILTCLGLFGLAWYSVENRMKEIALRKVSGATEMQVMEVLCSRFVKWILIAFLIALPVGGYFTLQWIKPVSYTHLSASSLYKCCASFILSVDSHFWVAFVLSL